MAAKNGTNHHSTVLTDGQIMANAEEIAMQVYPEDWIESSGIDGFKIDNNAGKRDCAVDIAERFLSVLKSQDTARLVMKAFYRREHNKEPADDEVARLSAMMGTALLAYELKLKDDVQRRNTTWSEENS